MQKKNKNKNKNSPSHRRRGCIVEIIGFTILRETHTYTHTRYSRCRIRRPNQRGLTGRKGGTIRGDGSSKVKKESVL